MSCIGCNKHKSDGQHYDFFHKKSVYRLDQLEPQIWLVNEAHKSIFHDLQGALVGGVTTVFHREHIVGQTTLHRPFFQESTDTWENTSNGVTVQRILSFDANHLYPYAMTRGVLCGRAWRDKRDLTPAQLEREIREGTFFGLALVDMRVPKSKWTYFAELCPFFVNQEIPNESIGPYMRDVGRRMDKMTPAKKLVGVLHTEKTFLHTDLILFLLNHGVLLTVVHRGSIRYKRGNPYGDFVSWVAEERREGDKANDPIRSNMAKFLANSAFGRTILRKDTQKSVSYTTDPQVARNSINQMFRCSVMEVSPGVFELTKEKKSYAQNTPIQVGVGIFQISKLRILEFFYDCLDLYFPRSCYQLCYMDTDSLWVSFSQKNLDQMVKPELKEKWKNEKHKWFAHLYETEEERKYHARSPGLFKIEMDAQRACWLTSKSYYAERVDTPSDFTVKSQEDFVDALKTGKIKISSKGTKKESNWSKLSLKTFQEVLSSGNPVSVENRGVRYLNGMVNYLQVQTGISAYYDKRRVLGDGVSTVPLDL